MIKLVLPILFVANIAIAAEVPKSPYIAIVYPYAEAMIKADRAKVPLGQNDLRLFYTLSELSGRPNYKIAADAQVKWLLQNPAGMSEGSRPWMLWERCFEINPDRSRALVEKSSSIRAFAVAYQQTKDEKFLKLIESAMVAGKSSIEHISLAIDAWGAAARVPEPLATKLRQFAQSQDEAFLSAANQSINPALAMLCVSRYENTGNIKYRDLFQAAADAVNKDLTWELSPMTFGHIVSLQLAAWRSTSRQEYLDAARKYADMAVKKFWTAGNPIPTMTMGADSLVLSLLDLHLSILHITAVRCPPNTIDR